MDTDDLSQETYKAVIIEAEKFNHDLTLEFGVLSYQCNNEEEYLLSAKKMILDWREDLSVAMMDIFYDDNPPSQNAFKEVLLKIESNIEKVEKIPYKNRKFDF